MKKLAVGLNKPSLQLALSGGAMEEAASSLTGGAWEQYIINYLISHCDVGDLEPIDEENSSSDSEDSDFGHEEDEPAPVAQSRKKKGKQRTCNVLLQRCTGMAG
jgi:hypothetical protein